MDKRDREFNATMRLLDDAQYYHVFEKFGKYFCVLKDEKGNEVARSGAQASKSMALGFVPIAGAAGKIINVTEKRNVVKSSSKKERQQLNWIVVPKIFNACDQHLKRSTANCPA